MDQVRGAANPFPSQVPSRRDTRIRSSPSLLTAKSVACIKDSSWIPERRENCWRLMCCQVGVDGGKVGLTDQNKKGPTAKPGSVCSRGRCWSECCQASSVSVARLPTNVNALLYIESGLERDDTNLTGFLDHHRRDHHQLSFDPVPCMQVTLLYKQWVRYWPCISMTVLQRDRATIQ